jgi:hypothetical protein
MRMDGKLNINFARNVVLISLTLYYILAELQGFEVKGVNAGGVARAPRSETFDLVLYRVR